MHVDGFRRPAADETEGRAFFFENHEAARNGHLHPDEWQRNRMSLLRPGRTLGGDVQDIRPNAEVIEDIEERPDRPVSRRDLCSRKVLCPGQQPRGEHPACQRLTWVGDH